MMPELIVPFVTSYRWWTIGGESPSALALNHIGTFSGESDEERPHE
jgi:hypothetical protein